MAIRKDLGIHADDLRDLTDEELQDVLDQLGPAKAEELQKTWEFWARQEQLEPDGDWSIWVALAGRGWGKTRSGAEWIRHKVKQGHKRLAFVAPTNSDIRKTMVEGESGLLNISWSGDKTYRNGKMGKPEWSPTNRQLKYANGATVDCFSAEDPERLRGPQFEAAWCDELCAWNNAQMTWDMLMFTLRLGKHPRVFITTTPKPTKLLRTILKDDRTVISSGSTYDNKANLAPTFIKAIEATYEGTRLGRQELYAEVLDEASGALWNRGLLEKCEYPHDKDPLEISKTMKRVVVAVDPAITSNEESDMTGIVVAGVDVNDHAIVLEDATGRYNPEQWASEAIRLYHKYAADRIVAERNQGGDMVKHTFRTVDDSVPVRMVHAARGKFARAEPVSALYEQGRVFHVKGLNELEDQMVSWEPLGKVGSPDRLDALVWAMTDLMLKGVARPQIKMAYERAQGLGSMSSV